MVNAEADEPPAAPRGLSFRLKLALACATLATLPVLGVGLAVLDVNRRAIEDSSRELLLALADDLGRELESELDRAEDALDAVGSTLTDPRIAEDAALLQALTLLGSSSALDHAAIYDRDGALIDTLRQEGTNTPEPPAELNERLRTEAAASNHATGDASVDRFGTRVLVALPLRAPDGSVTGFVVSRVALHDLQTRLVRLDELRLGGRPNGLFVVDGEQRVVAHAAPEQLGQDASERGLLAGIPTGDAMTHVDQSGLYLDSNGTRVLGSLVGMSRLPWAVVVQIPEDVAFVSLARTRHIVAATVAGAGLLALLLALLLARQLAQSIATFSRFAKQLGERRFDQRVTLNRRDELGLLGDTLNSAAADLAASEERIRREEAIRGDLGRYLPAEVVERVVSREQDMHLGGQKQIVTVLFADVVAFTPLTEALPAEDVVTILNELFTLLTEIVFRHGGVVDKFIGDCVMALFGVPEPRDGDAERALAAAEDMLRFLDASNAGFEERFGVRIEIAIGVHTGPAIVGNVGSERRMAYTAIGDTVNVAARLEALARPHQILTTRATVEAGGEGFDTVERGPRNMVGRQEAIEVFEVYVG